MTSFPTENPTPPSSSESPNASIGKPTKTTLANITKLPREIIDGLWICLEDGTVVKSVQDAFTIRSNKPHGHVAAVLGRMKPLRLPELIAPKNSHFRRLVLGMIAAHVLKPASKLATGAVLEVRTASSTLNQELEVKCVDADDLYEAIG